MAKLNQYKQLLLGVLLTTTVFSILIVLTSKQEAYPPGNMPQNIKTEYFLEVSEDSIWIESKQGDVYSGTYSDLDSLINLDNL
jgi:hypothetical protein